ncbi:LacI family DNA-binding transcriptional regulator [Jiangella sp. DSM 45060]|uniref:LacI family DNA-binding transcriptional regulator n=1 Tax=Jiangella sp. DSM 45060 TaxID=1798224 RepID=UPI00087948D9|nr:LacI family DNA-binding transcriptional regulator [Jiangella sp. DSM 45060]SDT19302.1 DNA-binding transcriptional regulator, LacI/PurR family [Jiangella sp. DSM 45060]
MAQRRRADKRRVTQSDVARAANVSTAIVSTVINGKTDSIRVSDTTRERVWQAVRDLHYTPNIAAQSLAGGRNRIIGAFTYQRLFPWESRDFYYEFLLGIEEEAEAVAHHLLLFTGAKNESGERSIFNHDANLLRLADGAILVGGRVDGDELAKLAADGYPFVMIGRHDEVGPQVSWVAADYAAGADAVVEELYARGHRRLLYVAGSRTQETLTERRSGFAAACARHRLGPKRAAMVAFGAANPDLPRLAVADDETAVLAAARAAGSTAVIAESSYVAHRLLETARAQGVDVPGELSIVGLGDHGDRANVLSPDPALTLLRTPSREIGAGAVRMLLRLLDAPDTGPEQEFVPCELTGGQTVGTPG